MNRPEPLKVSQLNNYIKNIIDNDDVLNNVYIKSVPEESPFAPPA